MFLSATAERFGRAATTMHRVRNLSTAGACIDACDTFRVGETLVIGIGTLSEVGAQVRWAKDGLIGLQFVVPIETASALARTAKPPQPSNVRTRYSG
ncbi:PilZ domain-containing protein [Roseomonas aeriglobus]|nr:PilZ domain-containing protein [Roseomonas aeriglobus]